MAALPPPLFVANDDALADFAQTWLPRIESSLVAVDFEEDRMKHYHPQIALIQLSIAGENRASDSGNRDAILDPLALDRDALRAVLEAICFGSRGLVMHGARNDVVGLKRDFGFGVRSLFDTQIAARFLGLRHFGLAALLKEYFSVSVNKAAQRSDWLRRPLSPSQIEYARLDTHYLLGLYQELDDELDASGWRDAFDEECEILSRLPSERITFDPYGWKRIRETRDMDESAQQRAAAAWRWRDEYGRKHNLHPNVVFPSWAIALLAKRGASSMHHGSLRQEVSKLRDGGGAALEAALRDAGKHSTDRPRRRGPQRERTGPSPDVIKRRYAALREWREETSARLELERGWLAPNDELDAISRLAEPSIDALRAIDCVREWQLARFSDDWLEILD